MVSPKLADAVFGMKLNEMQVVETEFGVHVVQVTGIQAGKARIYGQLGMNYHDAVVTTSETIATLGPQRFVTETKGWNPTYGGGLEVWINKKIAIRSQRNSCRNRIAASR